jgi:ribonuclease BN (tRNA processing enzyme)
MKLILLGTAGYHPNDRRQTACLMLPELGIVLDAGTGMYRVRDHLRTDELDIFLTHAHLDHVVGITYLLDVVRGRDVRRVTVHAAAEKLAAIETHLLAEALFPVRLPCELRALSAAVELPAGGRLTHFPVEHPGGAIGFRLDWPDRSLAYVTDTAASADANYVEAVRGVNLLAHECNFSDAGRQLAPQIGHSFTSAVAEVARKAGVGQLLLVHVDPLAEGDDPVHLVDAVRIFPRTLLGHDLLEIDF